MEANISPMTESMADNRKPYEKPEIIHELELETRAGSPIPPSGIDPGNLWKLNPLNGNDP